MTFHRSTEDCIQIGSNTKKLNSPVTIQDSRFNGNMINDSVLVVNNAKVLAESLLSFGYDLVSNGTDTHIILIDLTKEEITGKKAEKVLESAGITTNKNMVPFDQRSPLVTSGIRIGTPAMTTRGMGNDEMRYIAELIHKVIKNIDDTRIISDVKDDVRNLCLSYPLYQEQLV